MFLIEDNEVKIRGVPGAQVNLLAGSLKKYARKYIPLSKIREKVKGKIANEAAKEGLSD